MRFLEYETWRIHPEASKEEHDNMVRTWFKYVVNNKKNLFYEWVSARYFRQTDAKGNPNGVYAMVFEYDNWVGHHAYKYRKLHSYEIDDGVYAIYASNDPYQFFDLDHVNIDCLEPYVREEWLKYEKDIDVHDKDSFYQYVAWKMKDGATIEGQEAAVAEWFRYIDANRESLYPELLSAKYFRQCDNERNATGMYSMVLKFKSTAAYQAFQARKVTNPKDYTIGGSLAPQNYFNPALTDVVYFDPQETELWFDYSEVMG